MKSLFRHFILNIAALLLTSHYLPGLVIDGGVKGLVIGSLAFMVANILLKPFLKVVLLPLNLLTLGLFAWLSNVLTLYLLVSFVPTFKLYPYFFPGLNLSVLTLPPTELTTFHVAVISSLMIAVIIHIAHWLLE